MHISRACTFIPPWLLERLGRDPDVLGEAVRRTRSVGVVPWLDVPDAPAATAWTVHDAQQGTRLPGLPVRSAGDPGPGPADPAVAEAAAGIEATLAMWRDGLGRSSYDDAGARVLLAVHYGVDYDNAFWDRSHLVFGDGDGEVFERFTKPVDVLAHEFTHAVVEHTAGLVYRGQPGALNESLCDVFAACLKQQVLGQDAAAADWLVGEGIFAPGVQARALRDMAAPGTAFDDPRLGADPQVAHMDDFVVTASDNGGVHLNSGIPNRAFHLAAVAIGGSSLQGAGRIWYDPLVDAEVGPTTDFARFAAATVAAAGDRAPVVRDAWAEVGVEVAPERAGTATRPVTQQEPAAPEVVRVTRSGGFAGLVSVGEVPLAEADDDLRSLVDRCGRPDGDLAGLPGAPQGEPDRYVYTFEVPSAGPVDVPEQDLTDDLRELARRVLRGGGPPQG